MNKKLVALVAIIIVLIAAIAAVFLYENNKADDKSPLLGEWNAVESSGIDSEGNFDNSAETLETYKILNITEVKDKFFCGTYGDQEITGTYLDGRVTFYIAGDKTLLFDGYIDGDTIEFIFTVGNSSGEFPARTVSFVIFSKDSSYKVDENSLYPDITGTDLKLVSGINTYEGKITDFVGDMSQTLKITSQEKGAFKGTMEQVVGEDNVTLDIAGVAYACGDKIVCKFTEPNNHTWSMYLNKDATYAVVNTNMVSDIGSSEGKIISIERQYVADGAEIPKINTAATLEGDWNLKKSTQIDNDGNVSDITGITYRVSMLNYDGSIASGSYTYNNTHGYVSAYTYAYPTNSNITVQMTVKQANADESDGHISFGYLNADGSELTLISLIIDPSDNSIVTVCNIFEKSDSSSITGNWKFVNGAGGAASENYQAVSRNSDDYLTKYDLTIESCIGGFIEGKVGSIPFVGTYNNGRISYEVETDTVIIQASGSVSDGKIYMKILIGEKNGEKYEGSSWYLAYTKTGSSATLNLPKSVDIPKDWILVDSNSFNGENHQLSGNNLSITQYDGFRLVGTMEQIVGDEVVKKHIIGNVSANGDRIIGRVIDDTGNIWAVNIGNDYLRIVSAMKSEISSIAGQPVAAERVYTPNGENAPDLAQDINLMDTEWKSTYSTGIADGEVHLDGAGVHIFKFTAQDGNLIIGSEDSTEHINEIISAYTYSGVDIFGMNLLGVNENGHSHARASISSDGEHMFLTVYSYEDNGEQSVEQIYLEKA